MRTYLEVLGCDLERDEDVGGEGDVPEGGAIVARNVRAVVEEPRPPVHRLVQRPVRRVVLRLREGAVLSLKQEFHFQFAAGLVSPGSSADIEMVD